MAPELTEVAAAGVQPPASQKSRCIVVGIIEDAVAEWCDSSGLAMWCLLLKRSGRALGYFAEHYGQFRFPLKDADTPGLRMAQLSAIHAVAAHFSLRGDPAVVTMPTGSGKTAVLIAAAFVLRRSGS
ncbi:DEAD/DEAH box helicase family protein [Bradyrhizobium sp. 31Argb]|uniref:DEAD/DEAH box helicase family protein n=1 Tax=Bradyrhizobium sp. 31Argb TaxID=3141247 RepID=UPI003747CDD7